MSDAQTYRIRAGADPDRSDFLAATIELDSLFRKVPFRLSAYPITTVPSRVLPGDVARQLVSETHIFLMRTLYNRSWLRRVNIGCGDQPTPGWINLELRSA
jgi:hypothetical protein